MFLHTSSMPFAKKIFMMTERLVFANRRRGRIVWQAGAFPLGPSRNQLGEVGVCLSHFAKRENVPYHVRRNNGVDSERFLEYVVENGIKKMEFYMLHGVTVVIALRFVKKDFVRRYCCQMIFPTHRPRWALPIPYR